ncbi:MAG: polysaccharide pyruvyl transferase family protein, partial [candidate division NC10 bacterium]|nr:polysaccharide pyruvyl transferase family protein [candidate division NC10 bacterium]
TLEFRAVNKHQPLSVYPGWHPIRLAEALDRRLPRGRDRLPRYAASLFHRIGLSRFDDCDLIVQCGTPVIWPGCSRCEWAEPLWDQVVGRLSRRGIPVLNLGAGSCYPWEQQPEQVFPETDAAYLRRILDYCRVTTVRDRLARHLFERLGRSCQFIPCPALLAGRPFRKTGTRRDLFVINFMEGAGHYDWEQGIDSPAWRELVQTLLKGLGRQHPLAFLCHNQREYEVASLLDPAIPRVLPKNSQEYFALAGRAKLALFNRLHAAIAFAGIGVPSVSVGTDTRLLMVDAVGLPCFYVKEATLDRLEDAIHQIRMNLDGERDRLLTLSEPTWHRYRDAVEQALAVAPGRT